MYYRRYATTALLYGLTLVTLPLPTLKPGQGTVRECSLHINRHSCDQPLRYANAQNSQTNASDQQQPGPSKPDRTAQGKQKAGSPEQGEKKVPLKDFVPSEKIQADKAVDFPADI